MPAVHLLIKPASGSCNMCCKYCFYADETKKRSVKSYGIMSAETLEIILLKAFSYAEKNLTISFQGGEPTLAGLDFFYKLIELVQKYQTKKITVSYAIQTNGYALTEEWIAFFAEHHFLVGISLDGYKEIHNAYRHSSNGSGTFKQVFHTIQLLKKYRVDFNILTVITSTSARHIQKIYRFFEKNQFIYQQYIECLDPLGEPFGSQIYSLTPVQYENFLKSLFDCWYLDMKRGKYVYIRYFENLMMLIMGNPPESCNMRGTCGVQWVIEADGSAYPCDFYALDKWRLGNFLTDSMEEMEEQRTHLGFIERSYPVPEECKKCAWFPLCRNGCSRNCEPFIDGIRKKNYFCSAYREFFKYAVPRLQEIIQIWTRK